MVTIESGADEGRVERLAAGPPPDDLLDDVPDDVLDGLAAVLLDAVADGVSVGFLDPFTLAEARQWWAHALRDRDTVTWVARSSDAVGERIVGVIRLVSAGQPNGAHRGEVTKFLVLRAHRGRGHGRALMAALEAHALAAGRWLLVLDTETGSPADTLYRRWGWQPVGVIDDYSTSPDGTLAATTILTKRLRP